MGQEELIVISDLHLSEGYDEKTERHSRNEDFFFDEEFKRFLEYLQKVNSRKKHLVIAGDLFDFLQVGMDKTKLKAYINLVKKNTDVQNNTTHSNKRAYIRNREKNFGLGTEEDKSAWKIGLIADGHPIFFKALAHFLSKGHRLSIISGNHDIELYWEKVRDEFVNRILKLKVGQVTDQQIIDSIRFYQWFYYDEVYKTYIEHGNQYDRLNSFHYFLYPRLGVNSQELWLPFGSLFVRYFFNKLETSNPFADNIKPPTKYMRWAWSEDKYEFLLNILLYIPSMLRVFFKAGGLPKELEEENRKILEKQPDKLNLKQKQLDTGTLNDMYSLKEVPFTRKNLINIFAFSTFFFVVIGLIGTIVLYMVFPKASGETIITHLKDSAYPLAVMVIPFVRWILKLFREGTIKNYLAKIINVLIPRFIVRSIFKFFQKNIVKNSMTKIGNFFKSLIPKWMLKWFRTDPLEEVLPKIKEYLKDVRIIIFGHTHDPDIRKVAPDCTYYNTSTWTKVFSEEERIIREAKQFAFVRIKEENGNPQATLNQWDDNLKKPKPLVLFEKDPSEKPQSWVDLLDALWPQEAGKITELQGS